ncbi:MAG: hypothetical protein JO002_03865, partial [Burkholderiaceae bacterium]|nr:hypothetical protein [Burkholderiaceae bacterium]
ILEENIGNVSSVVVNCISTVSSSDAPYGTVSGLSKDETLSLTLNGINSLVVTGTGAWILSWAFPVALPLGSTFNVAISAQPAGHNCTFASNSGATSGTISNSSNSSQLQPIIINCI